MNENESFIRTKKVTASYKTSYRNPLEKRTWVDVDFTGKSFGRVCTQVSSILLGKHDVHFTPHAKLFGVRCLNYDKAIATGNKMENKIYYNKRSNHFGSLKEEKMSYLWRKSPEQFIINMVHGMIPRGHLRRNLHKFLEFVKNSEVVNV